MLGLAILLGYEFVGYLLHQFLNIPLPPSVIGLILLVISLLQGWIKLTWIEQTAQYLLKHMMIFFAPTIVGVMVYFTRIGDEWITISVSLIGSAVSVLLVTGWATTKLVGREQQNDTINRDV